MKISQRAPRITEKHKEKRITKKEYKMKNLFFVLLATAGFASCLPATGKIQLKYRNGGTFKIAQFTDMRFVDSSPNSAKTIAPIKFVLETEKPDVAILTGDQVIDRPSKNVWPEIARIFEEVHTPFAVVFGNHDAATITKDSVFDAYGKQERGFRIIELQEDKPGIFTTGIRVPSGVEHRYSYPDLLPLHVMTFNIRYDNPGDSLNNWQYRKDAVAEMITACDVDLLGTQEVLLNQLNDLKERLPQYAAIGVGRADGKEDGEYSAIFYKQDKFETEKSGTFWLSETPEIAGSKGWDGACERIATWAVLKEKRSNKRLFFINTHLDHIGKTARHEGVKLLLERAKTESRGLPVIISGDFNASPESEVVQQVLADGKFFDTRLLASSVPKISGTFHGFGEIPVKRRHIIDYIFVTNDIIVNTYSAMPEKRDGIYLSDHTPVCVQIEIK
jgi:endonuclease/exonuclease/phosphatase family metal-dependent hydrolase